MTEPDILGALTEVMHDVFDDDIVVGMDTTAADVAGWDSQAHIMLIMAAEQKFGVRFRTAEFEALHNVGDLVHLIAAKIGRS
jgi:acyl carrier protein